MNKGSKGYEDGHYYNMTKEEAQMSKIKYDPESNSFVETEGWRSWSIVVLLVHYGITLSMIVWTVILALVLAVPFILICIAIGIIIAILLGYA